MVFEVRFKAAFKFWNPVEIQMIILSGRLERGIYGKTLIWSKPIEVQRISINALDDGMIFVEKNCQMMIVDEMNHSLFEALRRVGKGGATMQDATQHDVLMNRVSETNIEITLIVERDIEQMGRSEPLSWILFYQYYVVYSK